MSAPATTDREFYARDTLDKIAASITLAERLLRRAGHRKSSLESRREAVERVDRALDDERGKLVFEKRAMKVQETLEPHSMHRWLTAMYSRRCVSRCPRLSASAHPHPHARVDAHRRRLHESATRCSRCETSVFAR